MDFQIADVYGRLLIERYDQKLCLQLVVNEGSGVVNLYFQLVNELLELLG